MPSREYGTVPLLGRPSERRLGLGRVAKLAAVRHQAERAVCLFGAAQVLRVTLDAPLPSGEAKKLANNLNDLEMMVGADTYATIFAAGQSLDFDHAIAAVLERVFQITEYFDYFSCRCLSDHEISLWIASLGAA